MPLICYTAKAFRPAALKVIEQANAICAQYRSQGFDLTLRQLYYQFVARDLIPNQQSEYKRLGDIVGDARLAGLMDWSYIVDRTRNLRSLSHWDGPASIIRAAAQSHRLDKWSDQTHRVEVWVEKDALVGVIQQACEPLDVDYFSCRGYTSLSEMWAAGERLQSYVDGGQEPIILHLGDHDPSGVQMTQDINGRLETFMGGVDVQRIALNMDQVQQYDPPPNPAKMTDSRAAAYVRTYGSESWELDALEPQVPVGLIQSHILALRDDDAWDAKQKIEDHERALLGVLSLHWGDVRGQLERLA